MCGLAGVAAAWVVFAGVVGDGAAKPGYFYYRTFSTTETGGPALFPEMVHTALHTKVQELETAGYFSGVGLSNGGWTVEYVPNNFHDTYHDPFDQHINYYDFAVIHAHGNPPNCATDQASFTLGPGMGTIEHSRLKYGGYNNMWLKWVWAQSCSWFDADFKRTGVRPVAMCNPLDCWYGVVNGGPDDGLGHSAAFRYFDYSEVPDWVGEPHPFGWYDPPSNTVTHYLAEGVSVGHTSLTVGAAGGRYKRCKFNYYYHGLVWGDPCTDDDFNNANVLVLKASASGGSSERKGRITVRFGTSNTKAGRASDET